MLFSKKNDSIREFYTYELANFLRLPIVDIRQSIMRLANLGFVKYNLDEDRLVIKDKVFNYLIQAYETESNIKKILLIQDYLLDKDTKLVLYGYDSFLFDFSEQDGVETLKEIKSILEEGKHYTKSKMGLNYGEMRDITKRL